MLDKQQQRVKHFVREMNRLAAGDENSLVWVKHKSTEFVDKSSVFGGFAHVKKMSKLSLRTSKTSSAEWFDDGAKGILPDAVGFGADSSADLWTKTRKMKQKSEIEIEFSESITYASRQQLFTAYCPHCEASTEMATPTVAANLNGLSERDIFRLLEAGNIHFREDKRVLVCLNSLAQAVADERGAFRRGPNEASGAESILGSNNRPSTDETNQDGQQHLN